MKKNKENFKKALVNAISILLPIITLAFIYAVFKLSMLPVKYFFAVVFIMLLFSSLVLLWVRKSKGNFSKIVGVIVVIALILGTTQITKLISVIGNITGADTETHIVNVMVMKDSSFEKMDDLENGLFGVNTTFDKVNVDRTLDKIEEDEYKANTKDYKTYNGLIDALYDGEIDAIIVSEAHASLFEDAKENYKEETRIIKEYKFEDAVEGQSNNVDVTKDTFSIFVTGIDTFGPINSVSRSDVNMIVTVNPTTHQILLTSIPRDYHVKLNRSGVKDKLTHAGIYGVNESIKTLEDLLTENISEETKSQDSDARIDIDYYLRVNFTSVINIVDALGGVEVYSERGFRARSGDVYTEGINKLNGKQSLAFVRERYNLPGGDNDRIKNQQALITGVINKAMSPSIITNFSGFLSSIGEGFEFSMTDKDLNNLVKQQIDTMSSWDIMSIQLTGNGSKSTTTYSMPGWNLYVMEPNIESVTKAAELILRMENDEVITLD